MHSYNVKANNFLTKPFNLKKFSTVVTSVINQTPLERPFIFIKTKEYKGLIKIWIEEIIYIKASGNYILIHTSGKLITILLKISEIEEKLKDYLYFIRIHKSIIISSKHVVKYNPDFIYLKDGTSLSIGVSYRNHVANHIGLKKSFLY